MPQIVINSQVIDAPDSGSSPNWAPAIIQFMQAVEQALAVAIGTYDVAPQAFTINAYNPGTSVDIPNLSFPITNVRAVFVRYAIYRTTDTETAYEAGDLIALYNPNNPVNTKWALSQGNKTGGDGLTSFYMTDNGQFQFTTTALSGSNHAGKIIFDARALEQT
jgi:hypothetical protein